MGVRLCVPACIRRLQHIARAFPKETAIPVVCIDVHPDGWCFAASGYAFGSVVAQAAHREMEITLLSIGYRRKSNPLRIRRNEVDDCGRNGRTTMIPALKRRL